MPIPFHSKTIRLGGEDFDAEAVMNNCSDLWTATVKSPDGLVASGAGTTPEDAMANAIARAEKTLAGHAARS